MVDALDDSFTVSTDGDCSLSTVGQHLTRHLHTGPGHLPDLLDLAPALPYQRPALTGGHHQAEGDRGPGNCSGADQSIQILEIIFVHQFFYINLNGSSSELFGRKT